jgi:hypothetical protein
MPDITKKLEENRGYGPEETTSWQLYTEILLSIHLHTLNVPLVVKLRIAC